MGCESILADFETVLMRLKYQLKMGKNDAFATIKDVDVAREIGVDEKRFKYLKHKKQIPFEEVFNYCVKKGIDANSFFANPHYKKKIVV